MIKEFSAVFAGGCFWCIEAQFQRIKGVTKIVSGYTGGLVPNPTYEQVCTGETGHFEAVKIDYQPSVISYEKLLEVFFVTHDPTQTNGQGADIGSQYLSGIFYQDQQQKGLAIAKIKQLQSEQKLKIATHLLPLKIFYPAQIDHQNYYNRKGKTNSYCNIIPGKIFKIKKYFKQYFTE